MKTFRRRICASALAFAMSFSTVAGSVGTMPVYANEISAEEGVNEQTGQSETTANVSEEAASQEVKVLPSEPQQKQSGEENVQTAEPDEEKEQNPTAEETENNKSEDPQTERSTERDSQPESTAAEEPWTDNTKEDTRPADQKPAQEETTAQESSEEPKTEKTTELPDTAEQKDDTQITSFSAKLSVYDGEPETTFAALQETADGNYILQPSDREEAYHLVYKVSYTLTGNKEHTPGSIQVSVPAHLFRHADYTQENKLWTDKAKLNVPSAPDEDASGFAYRYEEQTDEYIITNTRTISADSQMEFVIHYIQKSEYDAAAILPGAYRDMVAGMTVAAAEGSTEKMISAASEKKRVFFALPEEEEAVEDEQIFHAAGEEIEIDTENVQTSIRMDTDYDLLQDVKAVPDTITVTDPESGEEKTFEVLVRIKEDETGNPMVIFTGTSQEFDGSEDYDAQTHILNAHSEDGAGNSRAQAIYDVTYEAYYTEEEKEVALCDKTIQIRAFDDSKIGDETKGDAAYIRSLALNATVTGTTPFDSDDKNGIPGYDTAPDDNIVRTFDVVTQTLLYRNKVFADGPYTKYHKGRVGFEFVLPGSEEQIMFNLNNMTWLGARDGRYEIFTIEKDGKPCQVMRGTFLWKSSDESEAAIEAGSDGLAVSYRVLNMKNGDTIIPQFTLWMDGNTVPEADAGSYQTVYDSGLLCDNAKHNEELQTVAKRNTEYVTITPDPIRVSAGPFYNVSLVARDNRPRLGTWDFASGTEGAPNQDYQNTDGTTTVYGREYCFGITVELRNENLSQGLKGIELPQGDITFDIKTTAVIGDTDITELGYTPLLWGGDSNKKANTFGRKNTERAAGNPYSDKAQEADYPEQCCYNSGSWQFEQEGDVIHVTIRDYEINLRELPSTGVGRGISYYNASNIENNYWDIPIGVFSSGKIHLIQPYIDKDGVHVLEKLGKTAGTVNSGIQDQNMRAVSVSGTSIGTVPDNSNQTCQIDDAANRMLYLALQKGTISLSINYVELGAGWDHPFTPGCTKSGYDWGVPGTPISILGFISHSLNEGEYVGTGYDELIKFDDKFFKLNDVSGLTGGQLTAKVLYAARPEGTGWDHFGLQPNEKGYDQQMQNATADNLIFYRSLAQLEADGKTCVGAMVEYRGCGKEIESYPGLRLNGIIREDAPEDYVYMTTHAARVWLKKDISALLAEKLQKDEEDLTDDDYAAYAKDIIPSRVDGSGMPNGLTYDNYPDCYMIAESTNTDSSSQAHSEGLRTYQKMQYFENGSSNGTEGREYGDSLLVVGHKSEIDLQVEQTNVEATSSEAVETAYYNMDLGQRVADFVISPRITRTETAGNAADGSVYQTDATIMIFLPKDLHYIPGSMIIGSEQQDNYEHPSAHGRQGTVAGGVPVEEADIIQQRRSSDKMVRLTLKLKDIAVDWSGDEKTTALLPKIYFSCDIGNPGEEDDVVDTQQIRPYATIRTKEDSKRFLSTANRNMDACAIQISKGFALSIVDRSAQTAVDVIRGASEEENRAVMTFIQSLVNDANQAVESAVAVAHTPYKGDGKSNFDGTCVVTGFSLNTEGVGRTFDASGFTAYYTTSEDARRNDNYTAIDFTETDDGETYIAADGTIWHKLTVNADGTVAGLPDAQAQRNAPVTAIAVKGDVPALKTLRTFSTIEILGAEPGDTVAHRLTYNGMDSFARSYVVSRRISGLVWIDKNRNGLRETEETRLGGVRVTLLKKNGEEYEPYRVDGQEVFTTTRADGTYQFDDMPAGEYRVLFENVDADYILTAKNAGNDTTIDSDAVIAQNQTAGAAAKYMIENIKMPETAGITVQRYVVPHLDAGFYLQPYDLTIEKVIDSEDTDETSFQVKVTFSNIDKKDEPDSYEVEYFKDQAKPESTAVLKSGGMVWIRAGYRTVIKDIPKNAGYQLEEQVTGGYVQTASSDTAGTMTKNQSASFTNTPPISVSVDKAWSDDDNRDGIRPTSVQVYLLADEERVGNAVILNKANNWSYTWENLPAKRKDGNAFRAIVYSVEEEEVSGYTAGVRGNTEDGFTITNTHIPEPTTYTVSKIWKDADNADGKRPSEISVQLKADGEDAGAPVTLKEENNWTYQWKNLKKNRYDEESGSSVEIVYTADETRVPAGYTRTIKSAAKTSIEIENSYQPDTTTYTVSKIWKDADDQDGKRPERILVQLQRDGEPYGDAVALNEENGWSYTWTKLQKNHFVEASGEETEGKSVPYEYSADETEVPDGYEKTVQKDADDPGVIITNTHTPEKTSATVRKVWEDEENKDGNRPESIEVTLKSGEAIVETVTLNDANGWTASITDLDVYTAGEKNSYTWVETTEADGYVLKSNETVGTVTTLTNQYIPVAGRAILNKTDDEGNILAGAVFKLQRRQHQETDFTWSDYRTGLITDANGQILVENLPKGSYRFVETKAPEGYYVDPDTEAEVFDITKEGQVVRQSGRYIAADQDVPVISVKNIRTSVTVSKVDENGNALKGAVLTIKDEKGNVLRDDEGNLLYQITTTGKPAVIRTLPQGNYLLSEISAPNGYRLASDVPFTIGEGDNGKVSVVMTDQKESPTKHSLTVTKQLSVDKDGALELKEGTFYVALFSDAEGTKRVSNVEAIQFRNQSASSVKFRNLTRNKTYYVFETDDAGIPLTRASWKNTEYSPNYANGQAVTIADENENQFTFENVFRKKPSGGNLVPETETNTEKQTEKTTEKPNDKKKQNTSVKTGDKTPIELYLALLFAAFVMMIGSGKVLRRKKNK